MKDGLAGWQQAIIIGLLLGVLRLASLFAADKEWSAPGAAAEVAVYVLFALIVWAVFRTVRRAR